MTDGRRDTALAPGSEPAGLLARAREIRRRSHKDDDFLWARHVTRPYAALILAALPRGRPSPNTISVISLALGLASCAAYGFWPGTLGLWLAWSLGQASFTADCMDGMQARTLGLHSPAGTSLDFLVDAIKQIFLFPAVGYRLWEQAGRPLGLVDGWALWTALLIGPVVASALATTTFLRSPEVTGESRRAHRQAWDRSLGGRLRAAISLLLNYPSWILIPVVFDRLDIFLWISAPLYALHALGSWAELVRRLCRAQPDERGQPDA